MDDNYSNTVLTNMKHTWCYCRSFVHLFALLSSTFDKYKLAVFTLETDYPSETGYPLDNSGQTDNTSFIQNISPILFG